MFKRTYIAFVALIPFFLLICVPVSNSFALEREWEVSTAPLALTYGGYNIQGQYFVEPQIGVGLEYYTWEFSAGSAKFSSTAKIPFGRYYLKKNKDGAFGKVGYMMMSISAEYAGMSASGDFAGPVFGGGYNWIWDNGLIIDAGYEIALISGEIKFDDGTTIPMQGRAGGVLFQVGYAFK